MFIDRAVKIRLRHSLFCRFSMYTWHKFLDSRAVPGADVYFDEIRFWLCGYPEGEPATLEQITKEEARLERIQGKHDLDGYNAYKVLQVRHLENCY